MMLWMAIDTKNKYRLPMYVTDNAYDMAEHFGVDVHNVWNHYSLYKRTGKETRFIKIEVEDD